MYLCIGILFDTIKIFIKMQIIIDVPISNIVTTLKYIIKKYIASIITGNESQILRHI